MSNFLTNLIARAAQQAPVLQRRQPALFEPALSWSRPLAQFEELSGSPAVEPQPNGSSLINTESTETNPVRVQYSPQDAQPYTEPEDSMPLVRPASLLPAESRPINAVSPMTARSVNNNAARAMLANLPAIEAGTERLLANDSRHALSNAQPSLDLSSKAVRSFTANQSNPSLVAEDLSRPSTVTARTAISSTLASDKEVQLREEKVTSVLVPSALKITQAIQLAKTAQPYAPIASSITPSGKDSVHITIGRVEVRAVTGGERPTARADKPATPRLKLDDYLRERSGGRP